MTNTLFNFFYMNGHGYYVWSAYGSVFILLAIQWFIPWLRWRSILRDE